MLAELVRAMQGVRVGVLGDPMLDYFHFGHVDRISPEAPAPVFIEDKVDLRDGGAGNVVANLAALGCTPISFFPPAPFTVKHRFLVGSQQIFRIDRDKDHSQQRLPTREPEPFDVLVISDYGKGWCTHDRCQTYIREARARKIPIVVDPKGSDWKKYDGATVICPNERELVGNWDSWFGTIFHKLGARGLDVIYPDREVFHYSARARAVFDVTGAGDTVVAVVAAAIGAKGGLKHAAELAMHAAGLVVSQVGTFPCSAAALLAELNDGDVNS